MGDYDFSNSTPTEASPRACNTGSMLPRPPAFRLRCGGYTLPLLNLRLVATRISESILTLGVTRFDEACLWRTAMEIAT